MSAHSQPASPIWAESEALFPPLDLTFLLHMAANRMRQELNQAAVELGLADVRDWLVLAALADGRQRTQSELGRLVCVDKTTLIAVLDRLSQRGLVARKSDLNDRRVKIPELTSDGRQLYARLATACEAAETVALSGLEADQKSQLRQILTDIAAPLTQPPAKVSPAS